MTKHLKIGVLAHRDAWYTMQSWQPTADYLTAELPGYTFEIVPLNFEQMGNAVKQDAISFVITSPGMYVEFEALYGVNRLATLKHIRMGQAYTVFGGVIFCRAAQAIQHLADLRGRRFAAVAENSFGGWRTAWREILEVGIDPYRDFQILAFCGSHDAVVSAVQLGEADAGTISTNVLERMELEGRIHLKEFKIINQQLDCHHLFPFALSTRLYPEWPFSVTRTTPAELAEQVAIALLRLPKSSPAAKAAESEGWTIPLNYQSVHECFQALQVHPYKNFGKSSSSFELAVKGSNDGLWDWNLETQEVFFSSRWKSMLGYAEDEITNQFDEWKQRIHPEDCDRVLQTFQQYFDGKIPECEIEYRIQHCNQSYIWVLCRGTLLRDFAGKPYRFAGSHTDITKRKQSEAELRQSEWRFREQAQYLKEALKELQQTQLQLIHSEKMSSLGQLVAGLAHEINNPVNFIHGNLTYLQQYVESLFQVVELFQNYHPQLMPEVQTAIEQNDLDFIADDLPKLLKSMQIGTDRIRAIVLSLRNFSRLDEAEIKAADIHEGLNNTLLILQHRLKATSKQPSIQIIQKYGDLPLIECYPGQLNQVFMNILSNAIDAFEETLDTDQIISSHDSQSALMQVTKLASPTITICTKLINSNRVGIYITDNGPGITPEAQKRLFDPFFTTKPVGKGTGLGLSISYQIIVEQHQGALVCQSKPGEGTTFQIEIPIVQDLT